MTAPKEREFMGERLGLFAPMESYSGTVLSKFCGKHTKSIELGSIKE